MPQINTYISDEVDLKIQKAAEKKQWTRAHYIRWATIVMLEKAAKADAAKNGVGK